MIGYIESDKSNTNKSTITVELTLLELTQEMIDSLVQDYGKTEEEIQELCQNIPLAMKETQVFGNTVVDNLHFFSEITVDEEIVYKEGEINNLIDESISFLPAYCAKSTLGEHKITYTTKNNYIGYKQFAYLFNGAVKPNIITNKITIPDSITSIEDYAFEVGDTIGEGSIKFGKNIEYISNYAWRDMLNKNSIRFYVNEPDIQDDVLYIGKVAIECLNSKEHYVIREGTTQICGNLVGEGSSVDEDHDNLVSISIPDSVIYFGSGSWVQYIDLSKLIEDNGVIYYENTASDLVDKESTDLITVREGTLRIEENVFKQSKAQGFILPNTITSIGEGAFSYCTNITSITLPKNLIRLDQFAFEGCDSLSSIIIPEKIANIYPNTFSDTPNLSSIVVDPNNPTYDSRNNCNAIIETRLNKLILGCKTTTLPDDIAIIGTDALNNLSTITELVFPDTLVKLEKNAITYCENLSTVTFGENFSSLTQKSIYGCDNLTSITFKSVSPPDMSDVIPHGQPLFGSNCPIYVPAESIDAYKEALYESDRVQAIPEQ